MSERALPNIIVTGTPLMAERMPDMKLFAINDIAKERDCITGYDDVRQSSIVDEDKLLDAIEPDLERGGLIIDWHCCDIFPERLINLVVVLTASTDKLYDRYKERGYSEVKLQENLDAEIMQVLLSEARDSYEEEIVISLESNEVDELEENVDRIVQWREAWEKQNRD
ncbi:hypothetical protein DV495_003383 [Geotrichum candidum]|nr:hypothetical protein DV495_003383 [Geotrichum candidum]